MKRKVIQVAGKTLLVSLPSSWAKKYGVKKGNEIDVIEEGKTLKIVTDSQPEAKKISIDVSKQSKTVVKWILSALYKKGYDEIEIIYEKPEIAETIQKNVRTFMTGIMISEMTKKRCVIRTASKDIDSEFDPALRRAFLVTLELAGAAIDCIKRNDMETLNEKLDLEVINNQLTGFCERILIKKGLPENDRTIFYYVVTWNLEKVCDEYRNICKFVLENPIKNIDCAILDVFELVNGFLREYYELFYHLDMQKLNSFSEKRDKIKTAVKTALKKNISLNEKIVVNYLSSTASRIEDFSASTIGLNQL